MVEGSVTSDSPQAPQEHISPSLALPGEPGAPAHYVVPADYYLGQINLKRFRARYPHYPVLLSDPLVIELERGSYAVLTKFGGVCYWNCSQAAVQTLREELADLPGILQRDDVVCDDLEVYVGQREDRVTFSGVALRQLSLEQLKIISVALCQSVALDRIEQEVSDALEKFAPLVTTIRRRGHLRLGEREILRNVGFALELRSAVLANLTLFDAPPETWESEDLARLHGLLYDHFDLEDRISAVTQKISFLSDLNGILMDVLNNRKSHRLEWIIIVLIAVEIVVFLYLEFL